MSCNRFKNDGLFILFFFQWLDSDSVTLFLIDWLVVFTSHDASLCLKKKIFFVVVVNFKNRTTTTKTNIIDTTNQSSFSLCFFDSYYTHTHSIFLIKKYTIWFASHSVCRWILNNSYKNQNKFSNFFLFFSLHKKRDSLTSCAFLINSTFSHSVLEK